MTIRNPLAFAALGLVLGLAAYRLAAPGRDGAPPRDVAAREAVARDEPRDEAIGPAAARAPAQPSAAATQSPPAEPFEEHASPEPPRAAVEAADEAVEMADEAPPPLASPQRRIERLVAAGFDAGRAAAIVQAESQPRLAAARAEYAGSGTVSALSVSAAGGAADALRAELGEADYERYLAATGQPTRVVVGAVEPRSAAANAGLAPGDEIRAYAGRRIFDVRDLNASMLQRTAGQTLPVIVVRDGQVLELYLQGGPLGMAARSAR